MNPYLKTQRSLIPIPEVGERGPLRPPMSGINQIMRGASGIQVLISGLAKQGASRVANDIAGYNVWIGEDALPDLTGTPAAFSATLPISVPITPPGSGTTVFQVVVTEQNVYGLNSVNQQVTLIEVDSSGLQVLPTLEAPQGLQLEAMAGEYIRVIASYAGYDTDQYPATNWKVWIKATPPDPGIDMPYASPTIDSPTLVLDAGTLALGTWYVLVGLYRSSDASLSETVTDTVVVPADPATPDSVS